MSKSLRLPALIMAIGLILAVAACLFANIILTPTVTEHDFAYSVTYKLGGETKKLEGVYTCTYKGFTQGESPRDSYYTETYAVDGQTTPSHTYTIAEKEGAELYIVTLLDPYYLMNDTKSEGYDSFLDDPYLEAVDKDGNAYDETTMPDEFKAEIVSWEYPEPLENKFTFGGFAMMHADSMLAMLAVGLLTFFACVIFVKKDTAVEYTVLDNASIALNFVICFLAIPFIAFTGAFFQLTVSTSGVFYQVCMCLPAVTAFTVAASVALRRKGFRKVGFFIQLAGPVIYIVPLIAEAIITNF